MDVLAQSPPGPPGRWGSSIRYAVRPYELHRELRNRYGDPFLLNTFAGKFVVTGTPEGVRALFSAPNGLYEPAILETLRDFVPPHSMQLMSGERHARERRLMSPLFQGEAMRSYTSAMGRLAEARFALLPQEQAVSPLATCHALSLDVIIETVFGTRGPEFRARWSRLILNFAQSLSPLLLFFRWLRRDFRGWGPWARYRRAVVELDRALYSEIARSREAQSGDNILGLMARLQDESGRGLSDEEIRDEILTLVFAGHETTGIALAWALYWMAKYPKIQARAREEVQALSRFDSLEGGLNDKKGLPYLTAICWESLRLNPVPVDITRRLSQNHEFQGYRLRAGTILTASPYLLHMDGSIYPDPERFSPERFLDQQPKSHQFLAFGGGTHRCIGAAYALHEMKAVLAYVLDSFELNAVAGKLPRAVRHGIAMGPNADARIVFHRRSSRKEERHASMVA